MPSWEVAAVTGDATLRLYRVRLTALWTLDSRENRDPVPIPLG